MKEINYIKTITMKEYSKKMDKIISMGLPVSDALMLMLEEASKYKII